MIFSFLVLLFSLYFNNIKTTLLKIIVITILLAIARLLFLTLVVGMVGFFVIGIPILMCRQTNSTVEKRLKNRNYLPKTEENLKKAFISDLNTCIVNLSKKNYEDIEKDETDKMTVKIPLTEQMINIKLDSSYQEYDYNCYNRYVLCN